MARKYLKHGSQGNLYPDKEAVATSVICWLCSRPIGQTTVWHHPVPKSRGGTDVVPMHPICQQALVANFSNAELERHGMDVEGLLTNPNVRKFLDWVVKKAPDFTASITKKQR